MTLLGFLFNSNTSTLSIPSLNLKADEIVALMNVVLDMVAKEGCVSIRVLCVSPVPRGEINVGEYGN